MKRQPTYSIATVIAVSNVRVRHFPCMLSVCIASLYDDVRVGPDRSGGALAFTAPWVPTWVPICQYGDSLASGAPNNSGRANG